MEWDGVPDHHIHYSGVYKMRKSQITGAGLVLLIAGLGGSASALAAGETTVGGKLYTDFSSISSDPDSANDGIGVDVKRFYFGANHKFDDTWQANITTDFTKDSSVGKTQVYIKKAYFQVKLADMATLRMGSADLPWIPYAEGVYGLRYVENTLIDRTHFGTSADWGLHLMGKNEMVDYQVSLVNGRGYGDFTRSKSMDISGRVGFHPVEGLTLALGGRSGKLGQDTQTGTTANTATRFDLLAAYKTGPVDVGVEYFSAKNFTAAAVLTGPEDKADGVSVFGSFKVSDEGKVFARYDEVKPSKDLSPTKKDKYFNIGYAFSPIKHVDFAVVYKNHKVDMSGSSTKSNEFGLWAQVAF